MQKQEKTVLVTGATGAIGSAIAALLAKRNWNVVLAVRDVRKGAATAETISRNTGNSKIAFKTVDLSRKASIMRLAESWKSDLDVLINNAAVTPRSRQETPDGIELMFATNVLGYYWMIENFAPLLKRSDDPRIINVASYWAGGMDIDDLEFKKRRYNNDQAYRQTKQADRMLVVGFAEKLKTHNIKINACHPGDVNSNLSNNLGYGGFESPEEGADTPVWLATGKEGGEYTGKYFEHKRLLDCPYGNDLEEVEKLMEICSRY